MKVKVLIDQKEYNQFGCGRRIQYLIEYKRKNPIRFSVPSTQSYFKKGQESIILNKLVDYYNYYGNRTGITKTIFYTPLTIKE